MSESGGFDARRDAHVVELSLKVGVLVILFRSVFVGNRGLGADAREALVQNTGSLPESVFSVKTRRGTLMAAGDGGGGRGGRGTIGRDERGLSGPLKSITVKNIAGDFIGTKVIMMKSFKRRDSLTRVIGEHPDDEITKDEAGNGLVLLSPGLGPASLGGHTE